MGVVHFWATPAVIEFELIQMNLIRPWAKARRIKVLIKLTKGKEKEEDVESGKHESKR